MNKGEFKMKTFIGTKIVQGEPMSRKAFDSKYRGGHDNFVDSPGYHVVYPNPDGDYHSWSPARVFEEAYRELNEGEIKMVNNE